MQEIKLIVTDLDGTFLSQSETDGSLEKNIKAMKAAQKAGIPVFPCTGRSWLQSAGVIRDLGFDNLCVVNNGASIVEIDSDVLRYRNRISPELVQILVEVGEKYAHHKILTQTSCRDFIGFLASDAMDKHTIIERYGPQMQGDENIRVFDSAEELYRASMSSAEMVRFVAEKEDVPLAMMKELDALPSVEIAWSWDIHLDVMAEGANKGAALPILADMYNIGLENVMALGDQDNDAPMLSMAGLGVAMGGASKMCKQVADYIAEPVEQAGFAHAIERFALNKTK
ncbi:MAG: Cof-type HAD-IIB family hydrolase [Christensenellales bacterium]